MLKNIKFKLFFFFFLLLLLLGANFIYAQEIIYPRVPGAAPPQDFLKTAAPEDILSLYAKYLVNLCIWAAGVIVFAGLIYGGLLYLVSTGKPDQMALAKNQISASFFGLLLLLSSFLVLKTLNPQLIILKMPKPEPIKVTDRPSVPPPPVKEFRSTINTEIPFGTIIEKGVFEGTIPWQEEKRIPRIKNNAQETKDIADKLKEQSENLKGYINNCSCEQTRACCEIPNPGRGCIDIACYSKPGTTSDPCKNVRGNIQDAEEKNRTEINDLIVEQIKTEEEVRLLKEQLGELERAEKFMLDCYNWTDSLSDFLVKKMDFVKNKWAFRKIKLWEKISVKNDWATFYCPVSGTIMGEAEYSLPSAIKEIEEMDISELREPLESTACTTGVPVGEIIDRTKRVGYKLVERLEELVELDKKLIDAVDKLQILISQCSSQRCFSFCVEVRGACVIKRSQDSPQYPEGSCPKSKIADQFEKIQEIWQKITDVTTGENEGNTSEEKIENVGIIPITEDVIPKILEELERIIRERMKTCVSEISSDLSEDEEAFKRLVLLSNCENAKRGVGPKGLIIQNCCLEQEEFQKCLGSCYLEQGERYKECLQGCLDKEADELEKIGNKEKAEIIETCRHKLNFYCCGG